MKNSIAILVSVIMLFAGSAFAGQEKSVDDRDKVLILAQIFADTGMTREEKDAVLMKFEGGIDRYVIITPIKLAKDKQTFLAVGNSLPFVGASKPYCWVYEKSGEEMFRIADLGVCENVSPLLTKHNGYHDFIDLMHSGAKGKLTKTIYRFDGRKYR